MRKGTDVVIRTRFDSWWSGSKDSGTKAAETAAGSEVDVSSVGEQLPEAKNHFHGLLADGLSICECLSGSCVCLRQSGLNRRIKFHNSQIQSQPILQLSNVPYSCE